MNSPPVYFKYWGKADRGDYGAYHLLPYHCLDVAAVGWHLLNPRESLCQELAISLGVKSEWLQQWFCFCLALHDLGKFATAFQGIVSHGSPDLVPPNPRMHYTERHDSLGFWLWRETLSIQIEKSLVGDDKCLNKIEPWLEIVTGHHGIPPKKSGGRISNFFELEDETAAYLFAKNVYILFLSDFDHAPLCSSELKKQLKTASWQLAGIVVLSDWLGSDSEYFKYNRKPEELSAYWHKQALPAAEKSIKAIPAKPKVSLFNGLSDLFPFIKEPTPLQKYAINEPLNKKQQLFILEDVTGAGKTEAALVLTHRMLSSGIADGVYVALPTMATANAMFQRLGRVYRRFFESRELPSLILAHGARELCETFRETVILSGNPSDEQNYGDRLNEHDQELSATSYCNAWIADNRKKALLADVGVGTLDQVLLAVLPARHQSLRLLGISRKILLVDEVHAYDSYMQKLLDTLLEAHARQGGSVILLSATLPQAMRRKLIEAFYRGVNEYAPKIKSNYYPLATHTHSASECEKHIDTRKEVKRTVNIVRLDSVESVIRQIQQAVIKGQCVCWIRNTVRAARDSYHTLVSCEWLDKDHLHLFHSRFAMVDRQEIESETLRRFGEQSNRKDRQGQVLIATQVVEQSLDLDFDVLITDLAPIDLIIQRAGRLKRHVRDTQGNRIRDVFAKDKRGPAILYLFAPDPQDKVDADWLKKHQDGTQEVYPHIGQLWLTAKLLLVDGKRKVTMPDDARRLIQGVYSSEAEDAIPESLIDASMEAVGNTLTKQSMASLNALKLNKGYTRSSGDWDEENRVPTRLTEQEAVSVALAILSQDKLEPYAKNDHNSWALSVVKIPEGEWEKAKKQITEPMQNLIDNLKAEVKALHWLEVFPLTDATASYYKATDGWQPQIGENS